MKTAKVALLVPVFIAGAVQADQVNVAFQAFGDPTTFSIVEGSTLNLRVAEQVPTAGTNTSTHVLIEGLSPLEEGTQVYASTYRGINTGTSEEQDLGVLYLEMPTGSELPEGTISSPIVGVVQRPGSWTEHGLVTATTSLGGASGSGETAEGQISIELTRGAGEMYTGTIPYTIIDDNTIDIGSFTVVKDGATSIDLSGATLLRDGDRYYGTVTNLSAQAAYDALLYGIELGGLSTGGLPLDQWSETEIGWMFGLTSEWGISTFMDYVFMPFYPYVYQVNLGWLYHSSAVGDDHYFYDWDLGWIIANENFGGYYYVYSTDTWHIFSDPQP